MIPLWRDKSLIPIGLFTLAYLLLLAVTKNAEELGRFGIAAGIVASIGLGQSPLGVECPGLGAGECGGVSRPRRGDADFPGNLAIGDDSAQRE